MLDPAQVAKIFDATGACVCPQGQVEDTAGQCTMPEPVPEPTCPTLCTTDPEFYQLATPLCSEQCPPCANGTLFCDTEPTLCTTAITDCATRQDECPTILYALDTLCNANCLECPGGSALCSTDQTFCDTTLEQCTAHENFCSTAVSSCPQCIDCPGGKPVCSTTPPDENQCRALLCGSDNPLCSADPTFCATAIPLCANQENFCPTAITSCPACKDCPNASVVCSTDPADPQECQQQLCPDGALICSTADTICVTTIETCKTSPLFCEKAAQTCAQQPEFCEQNCPCAQQVCQGAGGQGNFICSTDQACPSCTCADGTEQICPSECPPEPSGLPIAVDPVNPQGFIIDPNAIEEGLCVKIKPLAGAPEVWLYDATSQEWIFSAPEAIVHGIVSSGNQLTYQIDDPSGQKNRTCPATGCPQLQIQCVSQDGSVANCSQVLQAKVSICSANCSQCMTSCPQCKDCQGPAPVCTGSICAGGTQLCSTDPNFCSVNTIESIKQLCPTFCAESIQTCSSDPAFCPLAEQNCPSCRDCTGTLLCDIDPGFCTTARATCSAKECDTGTLVCDNTSVDQTKCKQALCPTGNLLCDTDATFCQTIVQNNSCSQNCRTCTGSLLCSTDATFCSTDLNTMQTTCNTQCISCSDGNVVCKDECVCALACITECSCDPGKLPPKDSARITDVVHPTTGQTLTENGQLVINFAAVGDKTLVIVWQENLIRPRLEYHDPRSNEVTAAFTKEKPVILTRGTITGTDPPVD